MADEDLRRQIAELAVRVAALESAANRSEVNASGQNVAAPEAGRQDQPGRNSLEDRIGAQLFNRVGIIAVLVGVAWLLKFAFDRAWVGPEPRVLGGLLAGAGLVLWSERFHSRGFAAFSYSLKAIGTGVLYLTLWSAYALFHIVGAGVDTVAMLAVTGANGWLAWRQESELLAFYALACGYLTPLLLSSWSSRELPLFAYLLLLDFTAVLLSYVRHWPRLVPAGFLATSGFAIAWYARHGGNQDFPLTLTFIAIFFLVFSFALEMLPATGWLRVLPLANAALAFREVYLLVKPGPGETALIACCFAAFYAWRSLGGKAAHRALRVLALNGFLLLAALFAVNWLWAGVVTDRGMGRQFSYSAVLLLFGAGLLAVGFWRQSGFLRWQGLALLVAAVPKIFLVDIGRLSQGYRIVSFLALGVLLLAVSFVYQKDWLNLRHKSRGA